MEIVGAEERSDVVSVGEQGHVKNVLVVTGGMVEHARFVMQREIAIVVNRLEVVSGIAAHVTNVGI